MELKLEWVKMLELLGWGECIFHVRHVNFGGLEGRALGLNCASSCPVLQNVIVFGNKVFKKVVKLK